MKIEWERINEDKSLAKVGRWVLSARDMRRGWVGCIEHPCLIESARVDSREEAEAAAEALVRDLLDPFIEAADTKPASRMGDTEPGRLHQLLEESREPGWIEDVTNQADPLAESGAAGVAPRVRQAATCEWKEVEPGEWTSTFGEWSLAVSREDTERPEACWVWDVRGGAGANGCWREGVCSTLEEAMAAALEEVMAAAQAATQRQRLSTSEWQKIGSGHWIREIGGLRVEVRQRMSGTWWSVVALLSRCGHDDVFVASHLAFDAEAARKDADSWLEDRGVIR